MCDEAKLFVGGLNFETTDHVLQDLFGKYGNLTDACVVKDRETNRSRGFGFVTFENAEDAKDAMQALNGKSVDGRQIRVDHAGKSSGERRGGRGGSGGRGGGYFRGSRGDRGDRGYGGGRFERSSGGGGGGYSSRGSSREYYGRSQGGYSDRSGGSYRDSYDSYATHNE